MEEKSYILFGFFQSKFANWYFYFQSINWIIVFWVFSHPRLAAFVQVSLAKGVCGSRLGFDLSASWAGSGSTIHVWHLHLNYLMANQLAKATHIFVLRDWRSFGWQQSVARLLPNQVASSFLHQRKRILTWSSDHRCNTNPTFARNFLHAFTSTKQKEREGESERERARDNDLHNWFSISSFNWHHFGLIWCAN